MVLQGDYWLGCRTCTTSSHVSYHPDTWQETMNLLDDEVSRRILLSPPNGDTVQTVWDVVRLVMPPPYH